MKINLVRIEVATCLASLGSQKGYSQGTFYNLDFESVILPLIPAMNGCVPTANALPGWTAYLDGIPRDCVLDNNQFLGGPSVTLVDSLWPSPLPYRSIEGFFSVYLHAGAGIGQTGQIPNDASSLFFLTSGFSYLPVSFGGHSIPMVQF